MLYWWYFAILFSLYTLRRFFYTIFSSAFQLFTIGFSFNFVVFFVLFLPCHPFPTLFFLFCAKKKHQTFFGTLALLALIESETKTKKNRNKKQTKSATVLMDDEDVEQRCFCSCTGCLFFTFLLSLCSTVRVNTLLKRHNITFYMRLLAPLTTQKGLARTI